MLTNGVSQKDVNMAGVGMIILFGAAAVMCLNLHKFVSLNMHCTAQWRIKNFWILDPLKNIKELWLITSHEVCSNFMQGHFTYSGC